MASSLPTACAMELLAAQAEREAARAEHQELAELVQALRDTVDDLEDRLGTDGASPPSTAGVERT